jgi:hypothetical protein
LSAKFTQTPPLIPTLNVPPDLLYGVILGPTVGSILAWSLPYLLDRHDKKLQLQILRTQIPKIDKIYNSHKKNGEERLRLLNEKRTEITSLLEKGMMDDTTYQILDGRIIDCIESAKKETISPVTTDVKSVTDTSNVSNVHNRILKYTSDGKPIGG